MNVLDTSVWIRFLSNRAPYAVELDGLLGRDEVRVVPHSDVVAFVRDRKLYGRGVGWIDVHLLASALVGRLKLWTTDPALVALAKELGISYD